MQIKRVAALAAALLLTACGGEEPPRVQLRAVSDACQKIDKLSAEACECRAGVLASKLGPEAFEIYAWYRGHWAGDVLYPEAAQQAAKDTAERFKRQPAEIATIALAEETYAEDLKTCDK